MGRLATQVALLLQGKHKVGYSREGNTGDSVRVYGIQSLKFSGKKMQNKIYHRHTSHPGGLKTESLDYLFSKNPCKVFYQAVHDMLPNNKLRDRMLTRLKLEA